MKKPFYGRRQLRCLQRNGMRLSLLSILLLIIPAICPADEIVINAVGDIMIGGRGGSVLDRKGYDYPFLATAAALKSGDIAIGNLEAPATVSGNEFRGKRFRFKSKPDAAAALKRAGFSVVTLANNHILDFGPAGLAQTRRHLSESRIAFTGAGSNLDEARRPALLTAKGKKIAFLAYSLTLPEEFFATTSRAGTAPGYLRYVREDIARLRPLADHIVVSFHWGCELAVTPRAYQVKTARAAIDAGAEVVIGHHPHVLQGIERYRDGVIFYSLGNFAFATPSTRSDRSIIARVTLDRGVKSVELLPLNVLNREVRLQPALLEGKPARKVIDHLNAISAGMGTKINGIGTRYVVDMGMVEAR